MKNRKLAKVSLVFAVLFIIFTFITSYPASYMFMGLALINLIMTGLLLR